MLLREAFQYATKNTLFFNIQQNEEINKKCKVKEPVTQQHIKNARLLIKKTLMDQYLRNWLKTQNRSPTNSREKFTQKEIKNNYQFENYLTLITKPAHKISLTRLRLGCRALRKQTLERCSLFIYEGISLVSKYVSQPSLFFTTVHLWLDQ